MVDPSPRPPRVRRARTRRNDDDQARMRKVLETQVGQLRRRLSDGEGLKIERELVATFLEDRRSRPDLASIRDLRRDDPNDHPLLVADDNVLALADDFTADELRAVGAVAIDGTRVVRIGGADPGAPSSDRYRPNYVTAMGVVVKALGGPEPVEKGTALPRPLRGGRGTPLKIAVIDTGISAGERTDGWLRGLETRANADPLYPNPTVTTKGGLRTLGIGAGHGTFVSGIIAQLAPRSTVKVFNPLKLDGLGTEDDVAAAMMAASAWGADIINLSLGMETDGDVPPLALEDAVRAIKQQERDVLIVAAAGNTARDRPCWPGALPDVTAVAALTNDFKPAEWSTRGDWVDCSTIGEGIMSTYVKGVEDRRVDDPPDEFPLVDSWALWSGTSFAAPQVTGAVAQVAQRGGIGPSEALDRLLLRRRRDPKYGKMLKLLRPGDIDGPVAFGPIGAPKPTSSAV